MNDFKFKGLNIENVCKFLEELISKGEIKDVSITPVKYSSKDIPKFYGVKNIVRFLNI